MNVVLATPPYEGGRHTKSFPPMGLLYIAAGLKRHTDATVHFVDGLCEALSAEAALDRILEWSPDVLGLSVMWESLEPAKLLLKRIKEERPDVVTVVGGMQATLFDDLFLGEIKELDFVLRGEADETFPELCSRLYAGQDVSDVAGLSYRSNGELIRGEIVRIEDLNALPFADRSILNEENYGFQIQGIQIPDIGRMASMISSRGCPYKCTFCGGKTLYGGRMRFRSAEDVYSELEGLAGEGYYGAIFWDDNFSGNPGRLRKLCELITENKLAMRFAFQGTLHNIPDETADLMHKAGFDLVFLGVESGSDAQLKRYNKPARRAELASGLRRAKKAHMITVASFITGSPEETDSDFQATLEFVSEVKPHFCDMKPLYVNPGSVLWETVRGDQHIRTLKETMGKPIWKFPEQNVEEESVRKRLRAFHRTFVKTWKDWRRIGEIFNLLLHNRGVRKVAARIIVSPKLFLQIFAPDLLR